ncbi:MAG: hypothetical protein OXC81_06060 [Betaproteobacteria bacterium]|nr:hypothetical protein [Betaproteobacteria bacterium]
MKKRQLKYPITLVKQLATHAHQEVLSLEEVARDSQKGVANVMLSAADRRAGGQLPQRIQQQDGAHRQQQY